jgi:hypothetical protein
MQYKKYTVQTFERGSGKWRASVRRTDGRFLWKGRAKIRSYVTGMDETTPQRALQMALAAIDRGAFSRRPVDRRMPGGIVTETQVSPTINRRAASSKSTLATRPSLQRQRALVLSPLLG